MGKKTSTARMRKWRAAHPESATAHTEYMRRWRAESKRSRIAAILYMQRHPERYLARMAVRRAIKAGILVRPNQCEKCQRPSLVQGHHTDYSKKLEVHWLCRICHLAEHGHIARVRIPGDPRLAQKRISKT